MVGELQYFFGKIIGKAHCALCDITHGRFKEKNAFTICKDELEIPFELVHLDELDSELEKYTKDAPCIIGINNSKTTLLINKEELETCNSNVEDFAKLLNLKIY